MKNKESAKFINRTTKRGTAQSTSEMKMRLFFTSNIGYGFLVWATKYFISEMSERQIRAAVQYAYLYVYTLPYNTLAGNMISKHLCDF